MNEGLIPRRYAKALYATAKERGTDTKVYDCMNNLERNFAAEPQMQQVMANPYVRDADKIALLTTASANGGKEPTVCDFSSFLPKTSVLTWLMHVLWLI